jgi:uncharacterized protein YjbI with pentapeptide repeats
VGEANDGQDGGKQPAPDGYESWNTFWTAQGMPWRTEPDSDEERQQYLAERRAITADSEQGIYAFRDERGGIALTRADVEWLVATHEAGEPLPPSRRPGKNYWKPFGPDLRGAALDGVNLTGIPLTFARLNLASLRGANLDGAQLAAARLDGADGTGATLRDAHLDGAAFHDSRLADADLSGAHLVRADLMGADLRRATLRGANLTSAYVGDTQLAQADLTGARLTGAVVAGGNLDGIRLDPDTAADLLGAIVASLLDDLPSVDWAALPLTHIEWSRLFRQAEDSISHWEETVPPERLEAQLVEIHRVLARNYQRLAAVWSEHGLAECAAYLVCRADVLRQEVVRRGEDPDEVAPDMQP